MAGSSIPDGRNKPWLDLYYEYGMFDEPDAQPLRVAGYDEQPFAAFRWEVGARDDYGFGPGDRPSRRENSTP